DARACLAEAGTPLSTAGVIGGGSRSAFWTRILANVLDLPLVRYRGADKGPAFGAARLARLATGHGSLAEICRVPPVQDVVAPEPALVEAYQPRIAAYRRLYAVLKPEFSPGDHGRD
ncbi:MAG: FGGY-family carbohydrate kinase, partial [Microvirga sp.]